MKLRAPDEADSPGPCPACPRRHFLRLLALSPDDSVGLFAVVPAQVATTALNRYCRPDDSTDYFAVVGRRTRGQASAEVICPNHLNRSTWDCPMPMDNAKTLPPAILAPACSALCLVASHDELRSITGDIVGTANPSRMPEFEYHLVVGVIAGLRCTAEAGLQRRALDAV